MTKQYTNDDLHIVACDVGQGDAILVWKQSYQLIIDGGSDDSILECLSKYMPVYDRTVEMLVATHPDADHITGLTTILKRYKVNQIVSTSYLADTRFYWEYLQTVRDEHAVVISPKQGDVLLQTPFSLTVLWPREQTGDTQSFLYEKNHDVLEEKARLDRQEYGGTNGRSIVLELKFRDFTALFTGDLEISQEKTLISSEKLHKTTLLKIGHHGSAGSTSQDFLEEMHPNLALISVGQKNRYGHPTNRVLSLLEKYNVAVYRTDQRGDIVVATNGQTYSVKGEHPP